MAQVLLLEPDRLLQQTYAGALTAGGYTVTACVGAQEAVSAADDICPDVVILELQLANHNGLEFLYEFRTYLDWQHVPVIVQSFVAPSHFTDSWRLLSNLLGIYAYLYKPRTSLTKLLRTVSQCVSVHSVS